MSKCFCELSTRRLSWQAAALLLLTSATAYAHALELETRLVHLRSGQTREWSSFPETPEATGLRITFSSVENAQEQTLRLRQQDVKQLWRVHLNGKPLGELVRDENDMTIYLSIPPGGLVTGDNILAVESLAPVSDDIRVGQLSIDRRPRQAALSEASVDIQVINANDNQPLPARITIVDAHESLQTTSAVSDEQLAVRPGVIYTANGRARFGLPGGSYRIYVGRGFEYSLASADVRLMEGDTRKLAISIQREVSTSGYVACDTHVHTLTHSGHGDATIDERMITLAGEGIELPIATDHNVHVDFDQPARRLGVRQFFTPVVGNEVTTPVGHFNIFPVEVASPPPNRSLREWGAIFDSIFALPTVKVAILNHARDVHSGVRPFGPDRFHSAIGENLDDWPMRFNGMEIVNSGAVQTDPLRLPRDWMALLNRGYQVTPVGSSDSHDVARHFVGQGRTYIRCDDTNVEALDVNSAMANFVAGHVSVSYGLLTEIKVADRFGHGDLATSLGSEFEVQIRVLAPNWVTASQVQLYVNGELHREETILEPVKTSRAPGEKWRGTWRLKRPPHDVHLVAIASGKGIRGSYWTTAKPYQPASPDFESYVLGVTGAVWLDGDEDGQRTCAREYAERVNARAGGDLKALLAALEPYDAATAAQAAHAYLKGGGSLSSQESAAALTTAAPAVKNGFRNYLDASREHAIARASQP